MRRLSRVLLLLATLALSGSLASAAAQGAPPNRFYGTATLNGQPAPAGTVVTAFTNGKQCGTGQVAADGRYVVDVDDFTHTDGCGADGSKVTFQIAGVDAAESADYTQGSFTQLNLTASGTPSTSPTPTPPAAGAFTEAFLDVADPRPCMPAPCDASRTALWNGDADAWAAQGVTDPDDRFGRIIVMRVQAGEPSVISNIARILGNPYLQITRLHFGGSGADEWIEISNLGGGPQDMSGWIVRSPATGAVARFPDGFSMSANQSCRVYSSGTKSDSCGNAAFNGGDMWPDAGGEVVLFYEALALPGADRRYSADPNNQPAEPDLQGVR
jgi:hypothetical protein